MGNIAWEPLSPSVRESMGIDPFPKRWSPSFGQLGSLCWSVFVSIYAITGYKFQYWLIVLIALSLVLHDVLELAIDRLRHRTKTIVEETQALKVVNAFQLGVKLGEEHGPKVMIKEKSNGDRPN